MYQAIVKYLKTSKEELQKVIWPSRREVAWKTLLVIAVSLAIAVYLGVIDYVLTRLLDVVI